MRVKLLSNETHKRLLGYEPRQLSPIVERDAETEYQRFQVAHLQDTSEVYELPLPEWLPTAETFFNDAAAYSLSDINGDFLDRLQRLLPIEPPRPNLATVPVTPGWFRRKQGDRYERVSKLPPDVYFFDIETVNKGGDRWVPVCAVAMSATDVFVWNWNPYAQANNIEGIEGSVLIGWNVQYDRSYVASEYLLADSGNRWVDLMSCWQAVRGYGNQQRAVVSMAYGVQGNIEDDDEDRVPFKTWKPGSPLWTKETHVSMSLDAVHSFYDLGRVDKGVRDALMAGGERFVRTNTRKVVYYCATDVVATWNVFKRLWPEYREAHPHNVSIAGHVLLGSAWLPLSPARFPGYYDRAEAATVEIETDINRQLQVLADATVSKYNDRLQELVTDINRYKRPKKTDPYYSVKNAAVEAERQQLLEAFVAELPLGLRSLDWTPSTVGASKGKPAWYRKADAYTLTQRRSVALLGLKWLNEDVYWDAALNGYRTVPAIIPHPDDPGKAAFSLFAKGFVAATESGALTSEHGNDLLKRKMQTINWISLRKRLAAMKVESPEGFPVTLPRLSVTGTITRRAADKIWQVASNPKKTRIGTELKSMVEAPPGYKIVGFDFDGQESRLAAYLGDAVSGGLTSTALSLMIACGQKSNKTDLMSATAKATELDRDTAKVLVYSSLYGAGMANTVSVIQKNSPGLSRAEAEAKARTFISKFKGNREGDRYVNGLASAFFNSVGQRLKSKAQRSPVLGAALSIPIAMAKDDYTPTVLNWNVQTSGVDCRDMTVAAVNYLFHMYNIRGRLLLTIHDEIRTLVHEEDVTTAVYVLQLSHMLVWAYILDVFGLGAIPASGAYASGVDVDDYLRKDPESTCETPTQPPLPLAEAWDIKRLVAEYTKQC